LACEIQEDHTGADSHAREAARLAEPLGDAPDAFELFGVANVGVWRTSLAVEAGQPGRALAHADSVNLRALASDNRRAALRIERARAQAMLSREREACRELVKAERQSPSQVRTHPIVRELVADLLTKVGGRDLLPKVGGRDLRGLAWRMNLI